MTAAAKPLVDDEGRRDGDWRPKSKRRFGDPRLVSVVDACATPLAFLYHERIGDLIDDAGENRTVASVYTLARDIHDEAVGDRDEWAASRVQVLLAMRDEGLVLFDAEAESVTVHTQLELRVPDRTYRRWHSRSSAKSEAAKAKPRKNGRFVSTKAPHEQDDSACGDTDSGVAPPRHHDGATPPLDLDPDLDGSSNDDPQGGRGTVADFSAAVAGRSIDRVDESERVAGVQRIGELLEPYVEQNAAYIAMQVEIRQRRAVNRDIGVVPIQPWIRAAEAMAGQCERIDPKTGKPWRPERDPMAYLASIVPSMLLGEPLRSADAPTPIDPSTASLRSFLAEEAS